MSENKVLDQMHLVDTEKQKHIFLEIKLIVSKQVSQISIKNISPVPAWIFVNPPV